MFSNEMIYQKKKGVKIFTDEIVDIFNNLETNDYDPDEIGDIIFDFLYEHATEEVYDAVARRMHDVGD